MMKNRERNQTSYTVEVEKEFGGRAVWVEVFVKATSRVQAEEVAREFNPGARIGRVFRKDADVPAVREML